MVRSRRTNAVGMTPRALAAHAAKLCKQAARHPTLARKLWAEAMAIEAELCALVWRGFASMPREKRKLPRPIPFTSATRFQN